MKIKRSVLIMFNLATILLLSIAVLDTQKNRKLYIDERARNSLLTMEINDRNNTIAELENNGVQRLIHSENSSRYQYDDRTEQKHVVEGGYLVFCRQRHGDKVRSAAAGPAVENQAHPQAVYDASED